MATTEPHLPVIGNLQVSCVRKESPETLRDKDKGQKDVTKLTEAATFLAGWELGTLQRVSQPRPGDVYHRPHTVKQPTTVRAAAGSWCEAGHNESANEDTVPSSSSKCTCDCFSQGQDSRRKDREYAKCATKFCCAGHRRYQAK